MAIRLLLRISLVISIVILCSSSVYSQLKMNYTIGTVGATGITRPMYSGSIFASTNQCLILSNGVKVLLPVKTGVVFSETCPVNTPFNIIKLIGYPNPVINNLYVKMSLSGINASENGAIVMMTLMDVSGRKVKIMGVPVTELASGYSINMSAMAAGEYILKAEGKNLQGNLKIFKSN